MQCVQSGRFSLQRVHQETTTGQSAVAGEDQGDAAEVAADDVMLLPREDLELLTLESALFECSQVAVFQYPLLDGLEFRANLFNASESN